MGGIRYGIETNYRKSRWAAAGPGEMMEPLAEKLTDADLRPVFDAAMKAGLNLWDTAYAYGMGTSEKILGEFLRTVPRDSYLISDKFTPQCADPNAENAVVALYETSAKLLGLTTWISTGFITR